MRSSSIDLSKANHFNIDRVIIRPDKLFKTGHGLNMDTYKETFETWNKIARLYEEEFMNLDLYEETYQIFCESIEKAGAEILEIGCGPGNLTKQLLATRPDFRIFGIDIAPNMITLAKKHNPTAKFEVMDSRSINEIRGTYNAVISGFCLPYLSPADGEKLISDSYSLLVENGLIYLSFVEGNPENSGFQRGISGDRVYFHYHSLEVLKAKCIDLELKEIEVYPFEYKKSDSERETHIILTGRKKSNI